MNIFVFLIVGRLFLIADRINVYGISGSPHRADIIRAEIVQRLAQPADMHVNRP